MNKADLVELVYSTKGSEWESRAAAERAVNTVVDRIQDGIRKDGSLQITGFGTFTVRERKARTGRNPQTGEEIKIKASKTVSFKAGKQLKESL